MSTYLEFFYASFAVYTLFHIFACSTGTGKYGKVPYFLVPSRKSKREKQIRVDVSPRKKKAVMYLLLCSISLHDTPSHFFTKKVHQNVEMHLRTCSSYDLLGNSSFFLIMKQNSPFVRIGRQKSCLSVLHTEEP